MSNVMDVVRRINPEIASVPDIPDLKLILPKVFPDERGYFSESYNVDEWKSKLNFDVIFKQDNHSYSKHSVVRGLHSQPGMGKLVSVVAGAIFDVAVDVRPNSETFGKWHGVVLDAKTKTSFWIPDGFVQTFYTSISGVNAQYLFINFRFLHGFQCISEEGAHVVYKCSAVYDPVSEFGINPFDEDIGVMWPIKDKDKLIVSERDTQHPGLTSLKK